MSSLPFFFFFFFFTCLISSFLPSHAFDITKILDQQGGFHTFNNLLSKTQLSATINNHQTITVLVVSDEKLSQLSNQPLPTIKKTLSLHVVLDYLDNQKLQNLHRKSAILTTLFQASGQARGQQGFLNVTVMNGDVTFGSAVSGSTPGVRLVKPVVMQSYSLSVLQVSGVIMMDASTEAPTTSSPPAPPTASPKKAPSPENASTMSPSASPTGSATKAPSPENAPDMSPADGPADASSDHTSTPNKVSQINPRLAAAFLPLLLHVCLVM